MKFPVVKILWGMFAFPAMYPATFIAAVGLPMLGIIAASLIWASGAVTVDRQVLMWSVLVVNYLFFAWLAVRCHRTVLVEERLADARIGGHVFRYLAALATATVLKNAFVLVMLAIFLTVVANTGSHDGPLGPTADPAVQRAIDIGSYVLQIPVFYLLARCSTLLPAIALGHEWSPGTAWRQTRGNGWRMVLVVFLLPWAIGAAVDWAYSATEGPWIVGLLAVTRAIFLALGVIALSLSYRELPPWPAPPPTTPPA